MVGESRCRPQDEVSRRPHGAPRAPPGGLFLGISDECVTGFVARSRLSGWNHRSRSVRPGNPHKPAATDDSRLRGSEAAPERARSERESAAARGESRAPLFLFGLFGKSCVPTRSARGEGLFSHTEHAEGTEERWPGKCPGADIACADPFRRQPDPSAPGRGRMESPPTGWQRETAASRLPPGFLQASSRLPPGFLQAPFRLPPWYPCSP